MMQIDEQTLRGIISMKARNSDFQAFITWLMTSRGVSEHKSVHQKDIECHWTQGQAQALDELLHIIETSEEMLAERKKVTLQPEGFVI